MGARSRGNLPPHPDPVVNHLIRQSRSVCSRIGAGASPYQAVNPDRWGKELAADMGASLDEAVRFTELIRSAVVDAVGPLRDRPSRVAAAMMVYSHYIEASRGRALPAASSTGQHMVYLLYAQNGALLYVGITDRGPVRLAEHYRHKPWFPQVCRVEFERYETRADSEAREKYLIQNRAPLHNIQHNKGRHHNAA